MQMSGNVGNPTNDNTDREYHRKRREMIEGNLKTTGTTTFSIAVFTDAKVKEQDEKQKEKVSTIFKMVTQTSEFSLREITNLRQQHSLYRSACDGVQIQNVMIEDFRALKDAVEDLNR